jgi:hypothetical protein
LLPPDHRARIVWECVEELDLWPLYGPIKAVESHARRPPNDPAILMLWGCTRCWRGWAARARWRGCALWWFALGHNLMRAVELRLAAVPAG